jgi:serine/threonine protein kinase
MDTSQELETVYLMKLEKRPDFAYLKVDYPPVVELPYNAGSLVFCLRLIRHQSGLGFIEPPLKDQQLHLVMIKQFAKKSFHSLCEGESPLKDASVLQQLGDTSDGILDFLEALEDDSHIYVICKMDRFWSLANCSIRPPADLRLQQGVSHTKNGTEEVEIKSVFRQLVLAVKHLHQRGVCHRNLNPEVILCKGSVNSSGYKYQLSDFTSSLLVPTSRDMRHWIRSQSMTICSKKEYMAPEVYSRPVIDEGTPCFDGLSADMWSLGVLLFEFLTGHHLHRTPCHMDIKYCHFIVNGGLTNTEINSALMERLFGDNTARELVDTIVAVESLSMDARNLMADLLREDPTLRLTAEEVLNHRWLKTFTYRIRAPA